MMPGMNGRQFLTALREDLVVEKPFDVEELLNKVALALFRAREGVPQAPHSSDAAGSGPAHDGGAGPASGVPAASGGVILVIDDDRQSLRRLDALLSRLGYTVVWMSRYTADLPRLARVLEPRAVLIDLELPEIGGLGVLRRLRAERALDDVPILMLGKSDAAIRPALDELAALAAEAAPTPLPDEALLDFINDPPATARRVLA
jgi:DNA-binding response OmpR family regulator